MLCTSNHGSNGYKKIGFYIKEMQSFTIDGHGSEFLFDGTLNPFVVDESENITLENFAVNMTKTFYRDMPGRPLHKYGCLNLRGF
ncbi:MAG: hypothetical protein Q8882_02200 [Bacillota bacterium]|nr:hypothetical protein [Bacillota bacterium]